MIFKELDYVLELLQVSIEKKLKKAGICYRFFSRVKSKDSLESKLKRQGKNYGIEEGQKRIEDIIGIRIILYYLEDIEICKEILENTFRMKDEWVEKQTSDSVFEAQKINGVFYLPKEYTVNIRDEEWNHPYPLNNTFEVQMRTVLFEGWHEIEHDIRYKDVAANPDGFWTRNTKLSRVMNSVIASLELCEWTMTEIFEKIAEACVEEKEYELALRSRFRLNFVAEHLDPRIKQYLCDNSELVEQLFSINKSKAVEALLRFVEETPLTPDHFVFVLNRFILHDSQLKAILKRNMEDKREFVPRQVALKALHSDCVYRQRVRISARSISRAAGIIYRWGFEKVKNIFELEKVFVPGQDYEISKMRIGFLYSYSWTPKTKQLRMELQHISDSEAGVIWHITAEITSEKNAYYLETKNVCEVCESRVRQYSRPSFMREIYHQIGYQDGGRSIANEALPISSVELKKLVNHKDRQMPVLVAVSRRDDQDEGEFFDGYTIKISGIEKSIGGICHLYTMDGNSEQIQNICSTSKKLSGAVLYWNAGSTQPVVYSEEQIREAVFEEIGHAVEDGKEYDYAFRKNLRLMVQKSYMNTKL